MKPDIQKKLRDLPNIDTLMATDSVNTFIKFWGSRALVLDAVRDALEQQRERLLSGTLDSYDESLLFHMAASIMDARHQPSLRRVINGTGVVLHTNLGRAPLSLEALHAIKDVASGYSNVEYDVSSGKRGSRYSHIEPLLIELTGAESALVVNNNAAAVMLVVNTLAKDGEVVTSRGELIEIGGSFRIPDVIERSEADLVEVGTTNKTRIADFETAITEKTQILLKVHPSNYRVVGFTEETPRESLVELAHARDIWSVEDLGSGTFIDTEAYGLDHEPTPREVLATGMDIVTFSGDKLLGGPQAGIIVGKTEAIDRMKKNPLLRALRMDKLTLAALEATLRAYRDPEVARKHIPVLYMLHATPEELLERAERLQKSLQDIKGLSTKIIDGESFSGGGALPEEAMPTKIVAIESSKHNPDKLAELLRRNDTPIIGRIKDDQFLLDVRTLFDHSDDLEIIAEAFKAIHT